MIWCNDMIDYLRSLNWTDEDISRVLNVSLKTLDLWERGEYMDDRSQKLYRLFVAVKEIRKSHPEVNLIDCLNNADVFLDRTDDSDVEAIPLIEYIRGFPFLDLDEVNRAVELYIAHLL